MLTYVRRRILLSVPVVLGVSVVVFSIVHLLPGDPVMAILSGANATPEQVAELRAQLRLEDPLIVQYARFLRRAAVGDFGRSIFSRRPVIEEIADQLPATLDSPAIVVAAGIGLTLGVLAAVRHNTWVDRGAMIVALGGVSMPSFWLGLLLILVFSLQLGWLPATGQGGLSRLILPAATIGLSYAAVIARLVRSSLLEVLGNNYIVTARAKGVSERPVVLSAGERPHPGHHDHRRAARQPAGRYDRGGDRVLPPGHGTAGRHGGPRQGLPLIQGVVLVSALGYVLVNLVVDLSYSVLDPRIRHREAQER